MRKLLIILLFGLSLSACLPSPLATPVLPTETATASPSPTATIDWFPATETPAPLVTEEVIASPTQNFVTGVGAIIFEENFESGENWKIFPFENGSVTVSNNHISMVLSAPEEFAYASHEELALFNFYGEITVTPNLCGDEDEYGIIFRSEDLTDFYRLGITCGGMARVNRMVNSEFSTVVYSQAVDFQQTGPPATVKISVWAMESEIRFFVNDQYLFSATDLLPRSGTFGTYIHSVGEMSISVNFSDLKIWELK